jgi:hypothetical protein
MRKWISLTVTALRAVAIACTSAMIAWHMESSCIGGKNLVEQFPGTGCVLLGDFLDSVTDVYEHVVTGGEFLALQHEQADLALDAARLTDALEAGNFRYLHGDSETHNFPVLPLPV